MRRRGRGLGVRERGEEKCRTGIKRTRGKEKNNKEER